MSTDTYTRVVLTVIAACLLWLCAAGAGRSVQAAPQVSLVEGPPQPVVVVGWGVVDARGRITVTMRGAQPNATSDPNLPVRLVDNVRLDYSESDPMPVGLTRIKPAGEWQPIRSTVEEEPVRAHPGGRDKRDK